jgi:hypothetical protein
MRAAKKEAPVAKEMAPLPDDELSQEANRLLQGLGDCMVNVHNGTGWVAKDVLAWLKENTHKEIQFNWLSPASSRSVKNRSTPSLSGRADLAKWIAANRGEGGPGGAAAGTDYGAKECRTWACVSKPEDDLQDSSLEDSSVADSEMESKEEEEGDKSGKVAKDGLLVARTRYDIVFDNTINFVGDYALTGERYVTFIRDDDDTLRIFKVERPIGKSQWFQSEFDIFPQQKCCCCL